MTQAQVVSLDSETDLFGRGNLAPSPVCVSFKRLGRPAGVELVDDFLPTLRSLLEGSELLIGVNVAYDMAVFAQYWPDLLELIFLKYRRGEIRDVGIDQKAIDIAARGGTQGFKYSAAELAERYGLPALDKEGPWRTEFAALRGVPVKYWPAGAVEYVLGDADVPMAVHLEQEAYAADWEAKCGAPLLHLSGREAYKAFALHLIACWGFLASASRVAVLKDRLTSYLASAGSRLRKAGLVRADGTRDTKAAKAYMVKRMGSRTPQTATGGVSLDKDACQESGSRLLALYSDFSQSAALMSRVEDLEQGVDLPLQVRFDSLLETSRVSTSKPGLPLVGVQAHNFPRSLVKSAKKKGAWVPGARECLEPRPGHVFVAADLPAAELRSISQVCYDLFGYSALGDTLNAGRDPHVWFGGAIIGLAYEQALEAYHAEDARMGSARQQAKPCNFGFWGGMGAESFQQFAWSNYKVRLTLQEAQHLKGVWLAAVKEARAYFAWVDKSMQGKDRALIRHVRTGRWRGRTTYCGACNSQFQELTATAASQGLQETQYRSYTQRGSALFDSRTILYTHDEIVLETPIDMAHDAAMELSAVMAEAFTEWHPDCPALACTGPGKNPRVVAPAVGRCYSKDMKAVWKDGRLQAWEPEGFFS